MSRSPLWPRPSRRHGVGSAAIVAALLSFAACTASGAGHPSATPPGEIRGGGVPASGSSSQDALTPVPLSVATGTDAGAAQGRSLDLPPGWSAEVWAAVPGARVAAWSPDGRLIVSSGGRGEIVALTPTMPGAAPTATTLLSGLSNPQGVAFAKHQGRDVLVVGEESRIVAWDYSNGSVSNRRVLVDHLPTGGHGNKGVTVGSDTVFYSLGSSGNRVAADRTASPERASIWRVGLDGSDDRMLAVGVRNGFGLAVAPDGTLFTAVNQADNQPYPYRDGPAYGTEVRAYINENPVDQVSRISDGTDLGWPYCVPDTRGHAELTNLGYVNDSVTNADGRSLDCTRIGHTMLGLPAHSAPLGLRFTSGPLRDALGAGALITSHGSWNRQPPRPPSVAFSRWNATTQTLGPAVDLVTGFQNPDGSRWGRCVTAVPGPDGSIYVTDDAAGLVYRITPAG